MTTATAPQTAPFETLSQASLVEQVQKNTELSPKAKTLALCFIAKHFGESTWGSRTSAMLRMIIEVIEVVEGLEGSVDEIETVRRAAQQTLETREQQPVRRRMLREGLLATRDEVQVAIHRKALNKPLTQPQLVEYLADYFATFIVTEAAQPEYEDFDQKADAERAKLKEPATA